MELQDDEKHAKFEGEAQVSQTELGEAIAEIPQEVQTPELCRDTTKERPRRCSPRSVSHPSRLLIDHSQIKADRRLRVNHTTTLTKY